MPVKEGLQPDALTVYVLHPADVAESTVTFVPPVITGSQPLTVYTLPALVTEISPASRIFPTKDGQFGSRDKSNLEQSPTLCSLTIIQLSVEATVLRQPSKSIVYPHPSVGVT